jgi:hypothetical protein
MTVDELILFLLKAQEAGFGGEKIVLATDGGCVLNHLKDATAVQTLGRDGLFTFRITLSDGEI